MSDKFDDIEGLFKDSFDGFEADVDPSVWENVSSQIGSQISPDASSTTSSSGSSSAVVGSTAVKTAIVIGTAGLISIGTYFALKTEEVKVDETSEKIENVIPEEKILPESLKEVVSTSESSITEDEKIISATSEESISVEIDEVAENNVAIEPEVINESSISSDEKVDRKAGAAIVASVTKEEKVVETRIEDVEEPKIEQIEASIYASVKSGSYPLNVQFENRGSQVNDVNWNIVGDDIYEEGRRLVHTFNNSGKYWVVMEIHGEDGQRSKDSVEISVEGHVFIKVPNTFTPNGDGINDGFVIETEGIKSIDCKILDRGGNVLFSWHQMHGHWDGRDESGRTVPAGTYLYVVEAIDENDTMHLKKGTVSLFRN